MTALCAAVEVKERAVLVAGDCLIGKKWSVDIVKIDDNKVLGIKIVRNSKIDDTNIVDVLGDGHWFE
jgi:hypothetical protein